MSSTPKCAVCPETAPLHGILVAGAALLLCEAHQRKLGGRAPETFDELAALMAAPNAAAPNEDEITGAQPPAQRRRASDRRRGERRAFPRPEGRRLNDGRRADDA